MPPGDNLSCVFLGTLGLCVLDVSIQETALARQGSSDSESEAGAPVLCNQSLGWDRGGGLRDVGVWGVGVCLCLGSLKAVW